jgi:uncharacterized protein YggE
MTLRQESRYPWFEPRLVAVVVISSAAVLATSIVVGGWKATHGPTTEAPTPKALEVTGEATRHLTPDHITWSITVHGRDSDKDTSLETLRTNVETARTYLTEHGLGESSLSFGVIATQREDDTVVNHDSDGNASQDTVPGDYDATQEITISSKDVAKGLTIHNEEAIADELKVGDVGEATCTSEKTQAASQEALGEARAYVRAHAKQALEQYGGASLGRLMTATQGTTNAGTDCTDIEVTASAQASYEIE